MSFGYQKSLRGIAQYVEGSAAQELQGATPHRIIQLLMEGALKRLNAGIGAIQRGDDESKNQLLGRAHRIIAELRTSLDFEKGGDYAERMNQLYDYMGYRLSAGMAGNNIEAIEEVINLLTTVKEGWDKIQSEADQITAERTE